MNFAMLDISRDLSTHDKFTLLLKHFDTLTKWMGFTPQKLDEKSVGKLVLDCITNYYIYPQQYEELERNKDKVRRGDRDYFLCGMDRDSMYERFVALHRLPSSLTWFWECRQWIIPMLLELRYVQGDERKEELADVWTFIKTYIKEISLEDEEEYPFVEATLSILWYYICIEQEGKDAQDETLANRIQKEKRKRARSAARRR